MNHTKEPWEYFPSISFVSCNEIRGENGIKQIAYDLPEANAKRIVACVNACAGITNEALDAGVVHSALINFEESLELQKGEEFCFYDIPVLEDV